MQVAIDHTPKQFCRSLIHVERAQLLHPIRDAIVISLFAEHDLQHDEGHQTGALGPRIDQDVDQGRLARLQGALQCGIEIFGALHQLAMPPSASTIRS